MDYPQGRHNHHHHGVDRRDEEDQYGHPPPHQPPFYGGDAPPNRPHPPPFFGGDAPPPPQVYHTSHMGPEAYPPPAFPNYHPSPPPQAYHTSHMGPESYPPPPQAYHTSHMGPESYPPPPPVTNYHPSPPPPSHTDHHHHAPQFPPGAENELMDKPSFRMYSKAEPNYSLTIRDGNVVLTRHDPNDPCQHWIKDLKFSTRVKDEEGFPSFALVNKATGQAIKHSIGATHPVQLTPYKSNSLDESVLWTESRDLGDTYRTIRMVNNIRLNIDAFNGDKNHGGVHDGTKIVLWEWKKGENQRWKIVPHCNAAVF